MEEKKDSKVMSDAARRRAEDRQRARELREMALKEAELEDKRRAEALLNKSKETLGAKLQDETPINPEIKETENMVSNKVLDIGTLLEEDPKKAVKIILEDKGVEKEDLDAYAYGDAINAELERIVEAFGGKEEYRQSIAEPNDRNSIEAMERINSRLSRTDVSEITVRARKYYKAAKQKKEEKAKEEKAKNVKMLPIPGFFLVLANYACYLTGLWILCQKRYDDLLVLIGTALVVYFGLWLLGNVGVKVKYKTKTPLAAYPLLIVSYSIVIMILNKIRLWLWYSRISFAFYRVLLVIIVAAFVAFAVIALALSSVAVEDKGKENKYGK